MRTPEVDHKCTGLAALKVWAEEMTQEKYFPAGDEQTLGLRYVSTAINFTMLRDHGSAEPFLRQMSEELPDFLPEVSLAADCYGEVKCLRDKMGDLIGDNFSEKAMKAIGDPNIRRSFANLILQIRDKEDEAVTHIEHLLKRCG